MVIFELSALLVGNFKWVRTSSKHLILPLPLLPLAQLLDFLAALETHRIIQLSLIAAPSKCKKWQGDGDQGALKG